MRPVLLGFKKSSALTWRAPDTPTHLGQKTPAHADFDVAKQVFGGEVQEQQELVNRMLYNKVRVCHACSKPNGFTLKVCNSCGADISKENISKTLNVFAGFMLGIAKSTFPLTISIRTETPSTLVLDDLLALSPIHVNVLPMKQFIPDWRYLLRRPAEGLAVARLLKTAAIETIQRDFLSQAEFMKSFTKVTGETTGGEVFDVDADLSCGFNFPPSQYQLHLQCIFPVVLPYQYYLFEKGTHFTPGRFFPFEYVVDALRFATSKPVPADLLQDDTAIESIVDYFKANHDLDAEQVRLAFVDRFEKNFKKFEKWNPDDFSFVAKEDASGKLVVAGGESGVTAEDVMTLVNHDKMALQSYGRPYCGVSGKPQGKFYSFPPADVRQIDFW